MRRRGTEKSRGRQWKRGAGGAGGRPTGDREPAGEEVAQQGPAAAEPRR